MHPRSNGVQSYKGYGVCVHEGCKRDVRGLYGGVVCGGAKGMLEGCRAWLLTIRFARFVFSFIIFLSLNNMFIALLNIIKHLFCDASGSVVSSKKLWRIIRTAACIHVATLLVVLIKQLHKDPLCFLHFGVSI